MPLGRATARARPWSAETWKPARSSASESVASAPRTSTAAQLWSGTSAIFAARPSGGRARGWRAATATFERSTATGRAPFYVTTILEENAEAVALLTSGRGSLPTYERVGTLITYLLPLHRRRGDRSSPAEPIAAERFEEAHACLDAWNRRHQFAPRYERDELTGRSGLLPDFSPADLYVVRDRGRVVGTLGAWDQSGFKQTVVSSYGRRVAATRPLYNVYAALRGVPGLPRAGTELRLLYGAFLSATDDDRAMADALVRRVIAEWSGRGFSYFVLAVADGHPLGETIAARAARRLVSYVYAVYWPDGGMPAFDRGRRLHLEAATL